MKTDVKYGSLVISLDFELFWGVRDSRTQTSYGANILGAKKVLPLIVALFEKYDVHATVATVGLLFCKSKEDIKKYSPKTKPNYKEKTLSPYEHNYIDILDDIADPYHSAIELILELKKSTNIEIGSHTFCHYYCWSEGQNIKEFESDIQAAVNIAADNHIKLKSIVFPRNQIASDYLNVCAQYGLTHYRGNPPMFYNKNGGITNRIFRFIDTYINISGNNIYSYDEIKNGALYNVKASRFLRPYYSKFAILDGLKIKRIKNEMTAAAKQNKIYHLWWHPHNFGINQKQNLDMLEVFLKHYSMLSKKYGFRSCTMSEIQIQ